MAVGAKPKTEVRVGLCSWCDHDTCHIKCTVENGKLIRAESLPESPFQPWFGIESCPKMGHNIIEQVYHPNRLNYPLKRNGPKGSNQWKEVSWDQALDEIAEALTKLKDKYGAETLGCIFGTAFEQWTVGRFTHLFGTPNTDSVDARVCGGIEAWVNIVTYGGVGHYHPAHPLRTKLIVLWGVQPMKTNPIKWDRDRRVDKMIVIDPRHISECDRADMWLQIRPGTDTALAMGWLNVIINEGLYDREFVEKWTVGFDKLKERVQEYPPSKVSEITWIPEEKIVESAKMYATVKPGHIQWGSPLAYCGLNAAETERAKCCLRAITGNLDVIGGSQLLKPFSKVVRVTEMEAAEKLPQEQIKKALGSDRFRGMTWQGYEALPDHMKKFVRKSIIRGAVATAIINAARTGKPYPVKGLITCGTNLMLVLPQTRHIYEAIKNLDFHVHCDHWMTPNAMYADFVLPVTFWVERPSLGLQIEYANCLITGQRVLPKNEPGKNDRRDDYDFWRGLGLRLGQAEYWPWETLEECFDYMIKPTGMSFEEFSSTKLWDGERYEHKAYEKRGSFNTPTGKVELESTIWEKCGYDPLPNYEEPPESPVRTPELAKEFPYIFISRRSAIYIHSSHRQIKGMRRMHPEPYVRLHPATAAKHGIKEGDWVVIENKRGKIRQKCQYDDKLFPQVVVGDFGWWFPERDGAEPTLFGVWESNVNVLSSDDLDHAGRSCGNWYLSQFLVKISKEQ